MIGLGRAPTNIGHELALDNDGTELALVTKGPEPELALDVGAAFELALGGRAERGNAT
jgi:hypothetical protein